MIWGSSPAEPSPSTQAGPARRFLMLQVVPLLAVSLIRLLDFTWRYRETDRHHFDDARSAGKPIVGAFLHGRIFLLLRFMGRARNGRWLSMCSKSLDGDAMAKVEEALGFKVIRGSSGRDGLQAILDMIRTVQKDPEFASCLAIDGSRGPRGKVQGGIISLAQRTGGLIVPITAAARPSRTLRKTWDLTLLPWPFARVDVIYGEPLAIPPRLKAEEFETWRAELEERLTALQHRVDEISTG